MAVTAYITRDSAGNPWPPVHEHEATAAIGLIQRLHEAVGHEPALYAVLANLHTPSADLVVLTELGLGVVELKHYPGELALRGGDWYAGSQLVKAGTGYATPAEQVLAYARRIRRELAPLLAAMWSADTDEVARRIKVQAAVCFTNPEVVIAPEVKATIERDATQAKPGWATFQLLPPAGFAAWVSALRFGLEQDRASGFAPRRLAARQIVKLVQDHFRCSEWSEIRNLMPSGTPYGYLTLRQAGQEPILFPLRATDTTIGRDGSKCAVAIPEMFRRVSRAHASLTRVASQVWLADLGSSHGTYINGAPVSGIARLKPGQHITLGGPQPDERICDLVFTHALPPEFQADATAMESTGTD